jgi:protein-tyrosine phosphatase
MYDIHCHLLHGVDDGAIDFEDSLEMCRCAANERVKAIAATPHYMEGVSVITKDKLYSKTNFLNNKLKEEDINLVVLPGMEVYLCPHLVDLYEQGEIITLNNEKLRCDYEFLRSGLHHKSFYKQNIIKLI